MPDGDRVLVLASAAGSPTNPDRFHNLVANPEVAVELGDEEYTARATVITDDERDLLFAKMVERVLQFGKYQEEVTRLIHVIALTRTG
jgi:deazaflavin-dependent oxidoreductase (nitroreductase family)